MKYVFILKINFLLTVERRRCLNSLSISEFFFNFKFFKLIFYLIVLLIYYEINLESLKIFSHYS